MKVIKTFQHEAIQAFQFGSTLFGKPKLFSHVYFIDGLLIDTGHSNMRKEVLSTLSSLPVDQVFITHHHEDHTGNLDMIQKHFNCPTNASLLCRELMKKPPKISLAQWLSWGSRGPNFNIEVKETTLNTENYTFQIIPIPGHAIDMVCLLEASKGWLFSADLWVYDYIKYFMRAESMSQQIKSIRKILKLDFDVLLCSHNPQLKNGKVRLQKKLEFFEDFYGKAALLYNQGNDANSIFKKMGLKETWQVKILSAGELSAMNMVKSVIRDETNAIQH